MRERCTRGTLYVGRGHFGNLRQCQLLGGFAICKFFPSGLARRVTSRHHERRKVKTWGQNFLKINQEPEHGILHPIPI